MLMNYVSIRYLLKTAYPGLLIFGFQIPVHLKE